MSEITTAASTLAVTTTDVATVDATDAPVATAAQLDKWAKLGATLRTRQGSLAWNVGDWYSQGAGYGKADQAVEIMDGYYSKNSLYQMGVVAKAFPTKADRSAKVSMAIFHILAATAKKDMPAAQALLAKAETEHLTVAMVKKQLGLGQSASQDAITDGNDSDQGNGSDQGNSPESSIFAEVMKALNVLDAGQLASVAAAAKARLMETI